MPRSPRSPIQRGCGRRRTWSPRAAPSLQRVLGEALAEGGWFDLGHEQAVREAAGGEDPHERVRAGADAGCRGDAARDARRRGGRLRAGARARAAAPGADNNDRRTDRRWTCAFSATPASRSSDGDATVLIDPFLTGNPKAAIAAEDVARDDDPADPRPRATTRRHGRDRQADRRPGGGDHRARGRDRRERASTSAIRTSAARSGSTGAGSSWSPPGTPRRRRRARSTRPPGC